MEEIQRYRESSDTESELAETSSGEEPGNHERRRIGAPQPDVAVQDDEQADRFQAGGVELEGNLGLPEHALDLVRARELPKTWECERRSYRVDLGARQICRRVETHKSGAVLRSADGKHRRWDSENKSSEAWHLACTLDFHKCAICLRRTGAHRIA